MVTVTRLDVCDATGVSVIVTVASLQGRTVITDFNITRYEFSIIEVWLRETRAYSTIHLFLKNCRQALLLTTRCEEISLRKPQVWDCKFRLEY
jgi:hypothetical protein